MKTLRSGTAIRRAVAVASALLIAFPASFAQAPAGPAPAAPAPAAQQAAPLLSAGQLDTLVAPVALYPDPLLSQVLAASTYPLEVAQAQQWLLQNSNLQGAQLMDAVKGQNWDPSVQALVAFPEALRRLASDLRWTTDLGNAFLAQQGDVMSAVQRMRQRARSNGKLNSTPQQVVTTETQNGQNAIEIQPADPQVIYVPEYSPSYIWGPPVWNEYPDLWYPGWGWGFGFGPGIYMGGFFPGWGGWGGWGWGCGWFGGGLFLNAGFFGHYGFHGGGWGGGGWGRGVGGRMAWTHNPAHRMGVAYSSRAVASRYGSTRYAGGPRNISSAGRTGTAQMSRAGATTGGWQHFGASNGATRSGATGFQSSNRGYAGSYGQSARSYGSAQSYRGYGSTQGYRSAPSYGRSYSSGYSAPRSYGSYGSRSYSAPRQSYSAPRSSSVSHSSGGGSHISSGGGGHSSGGGRR
ncbi:MAG: DUF3300 domain-containing protein [Bryobacteraceae bacterium]